MKIVFISRYQGRVERGLENYVAELAPRLERLGFEVEISTSFWQLLRSDPRRSDLGRSDLMILTIIYPLNGYWQSLGCRLYSWITGAKLVVGGHAGIGRDDRWNLYMFPDLFIAFSKKGYEWAKRVNPFVNIVKIPHGVNLARFSHRLSRWRKFARSPSPTRPPSGDSGQALPAWRRLGWPQTAAVSLANLPTSIADKEFNPAVKPAELDLERPVVVTAAHLEPYKRVDLTVKAVAELKKGSLLVLGEGPEAEKIDGLGRKLLGDRGRYLRLVVPHSRVGEYLRAADVFSLVSEESEAFGLVYLEALACNLPVVGTDDSLRRELVDDAGVFVKNPEDSREYARCLEKAIREDWGNRPVNQAKKFDWEKIVGKYLEVFSKLFNLKSGDGEFRHK